jgi:hypothetical protein
MGLRRRELLQLSALAGLGLTLPACLQRYYVAGLSAGAVKG